MLLLRIHMYWCIPKDDTTTRKNYFQNENNKYLWTVKFCIKKIYLLLLCVICTQLSRKPNSALYQIGYLIVTVGLFTKINIKKNLTQKWKLDFKINCN